MSFDEIFDLTAEVYFNFYNICVVYVFYKKYFKGVSREFDEFVYLGHGPVDRVVLSLRSKLVFVWRIW